MWKVSISDESTDNHHPPLQISSAPLNILASFQLIVLALLPTALLFKFIINTLITSFDSAKPTVKTADKFSN